MPDGDDLRIGRDNTGTATTRLTRDGAAANTAYEVINQNGNGILGRSGAGSGLPALPSSCGVIGDSADGEGLFGSSSRLSGVFGTSTNGNGVFGKTTNGPAGVRGSNVAGDAVVGESHGNGTGVNGRSFFGGNGVFGRSTGGPGVFGQSQYGIGVVGFSTAGNWAGQFYGSVLVGGVMISSNKWFRIDHPLDPQNKYLQHACVESTDMKNVYDGVVELDEEGAAWVKLPEWFEELNRDYRYQLTAIGEPASELHIAEEISENRFKIAGGKAGMRVCWQVTGIRKDRWAEANPIEVEQEKPEEERGRYLHPQLYGEPEERGIAWPVGVEEQQRQTEEEREEPPQPPEPPPGTDFAR